MGRWHPSERHSVRRCCWRRAEADLVSQATAVGARERAGEYLAELASRVEQLQEVEGQVPLPQVETAAEEIVATGSGALDLLEEGRVDEAQDEAAALDEQYDRLEERLAAERDHRAAQIAEADGLVGSVATGVRFVVAFLVPFIALLGYRALARRRQGRAELEARLEAERKVHRAKDEFIASMSHELRTPLTSIYGFSRVLEEDTLVDRNTTRQLVREISHQSGELSRMMDDLLVAAKADAQVLTYQAEEVLVSEELRELVLDRATDDDERIELDCAPALVQADRLWLRQVLRNLLANARMHGGSNVRLSGEVENGFFALTVADDGPGVPKEMEERLFERFVHGGAQPLLVGSVGLGLSVAKLLTEKMGGTISYQRSQGQTRFTVRLPLVAAPAKTPIPG